MFGRFSIADSMFAATAISFESYGADLSQHAHAYMKTLLRNPFVSQWKTIGRKEEEFLSCLLYTSPSPRDVEEWRMAGGA